jgi:hypothetical protein
MEPEGSLPHSQAPIYEHYVFYFQNASELRCVWTYEVKFGNTKEYKKSIPES